MAINMGVKLPTTPSFVALAFQNGLEYSNFQFKILNVNDFCKLCKNLVTFGSVPEITVLEIVTFGTMTIGICTGLISPNFQNS